VEGLPSHQEEQQRGELREEILETTTQTQSKKTMHPEKHGAGGTDDRFTRQYKPKKLRT